MSEVINYDVAVIGAGAGGLTSAMYSARSGLKTVVIERGVYGGQMMNTGEIENYPGFGKTTGVELSNHMYQQAIQQGVEYMYGDVEFIDFKYNSVEDMISDRNRVYQVILSNGKIVEAKAVIIATGVEHRELGLENEKRLQGRGVSYCAICDANFFKGKHVAVVGGGDSALEEANYLTGVVDRVTLIHRRDKFRGQKVLQDRVFNNPKIEIMFNSQVTDILGEDKVEKLEITSTVDGSISHLDVDGIFIYIGLDPISAPFVNLGIVNEKGYIETDENMMTKSKGVFAVGDVREKTVRQIATAVGDGAIAGTYVRTYIDSLR